MAGESQLISYLAAILYDRSTVLDHELQVRECFRELDRYGTDTSSNIDHFATFWDGIPIKGYADGKVCL